MDWAISIAANGLEDMETQLPELITAIVSAGGWIMGSAISVEGAVRIRFEFGRHSSMEIYTALMEAGLELSPGSHLQLAHLCHCSKGLLDEHGALERRTATEESLSTPGTIPGTAVVDLNILSVQVGDFDQLPESALAPETPINTPSA